MFGIGVQELAIIFVLALLIFGPKRLPELARTVGKGLAEFRKASGDLRQTFDLSADPPPQRPPPPPVKTEVDADVDPRTARELDVHPAQTVGDPDPTFDEPAPDPLPDQATRPLQDDGHGDLALEDDAREHALTEQPRGEKDRG
jgi:TatA/E family protein of Tat protein translocase